MAHQRVPAGGDAVRRPCRGRGRCGCLQARTAATSTLGIVGLYLVLALEATSKKRAGLVGFLCATLLAVYVAILLVPGVRHFYELAVPTSAAVTLILLDAAIAIGFLWLTDDRFVPLRGPAAPGREPD